jgi:hypothetical protein
MTESLRIEEEDGSETIVVNNPFKPLSELVKINENIINELQAIQWALQSQADVWKFSNVYDKGKQNLIFSADDLCVLGIYEQEHLQTVLRVLADLVAPDKLPSVPREAKIK